MTTKHFLPEKKKGGYFRFLLRQNWFAFVTNAIIYLILNAVILSMILSEERDSGHLSINLPDILNIIEFENVIVTSLLAVLWGVSTMRYLNTKVGVNFYHALPLRRESLYFTEILVKTLSVFVPLWITNAMAAFISCLYSGGWIGQSAIYLKYSVLYSMMYFFLFYGIMMFAASFTGTSFARIMTAGVIVFMPMILLFCLEIILDFRAQYTDYGWLSRAALRVFVPMRAMELVDSGTACSAGEIVCTCLAGCLFYLLGILIYRRRKSELSGMPVLTRAGMVAVKYSCLCAAATIGGVLFASLASRHSTLWFCIGALIGAVLGWMLLNTILLKSARHMFSGIRGFGIFCAAYLTFFVLFGMDVVGLDRYVPSVNGLDAICVSIQSMDLEVEIEDRETMESVLSYLKKQSLAEEEKTDSTEAAMTEDAWIAETYTVYSPVHTVQVLVQMRSSVNPLAQKTMRIYVQTGDPLLLIVADAPEFPAAYFDRIGDSGSIKGFYVNPLLRLKLGATIGEDADAILYTGYPAFLQEQREKYSGSAYFQQASPGVVWLKDSASNYVAFQCYGTTAEMAEAAADLLARVMIVEYATGETTEITDWEEICEILQDVLIADDSFAYAFTSVDTRYGVLLQPNGEDDSWLEGVFPTGCVPGFLS